MVDTVDYVPMQIMPKYAAVTLTAPHTQVAGTPFRGIEQRSEPHTGSTTSEFGSPNRVLRSMALFDVCHLC